MQRTVPELRALIAEADQLRARAVAFRRRLNLLDQGVDFSIKERRIGFSDSSFWSHHEWTLSPELSRLVATELDAVRGTANADADAADQAAAAATTMRAARDSIRRADEARAIADGATTVLSLIRPTLTNKIVQSWTGTRLSRALARGEEAALTKAFESIATRSDNDADAIDSLFTEQDTVTLRKGGADA